MTGWASYAADPTAREYAAADVISGVLYAVDGYNGANLANNNGYNPSTNAWTAYAADPTARYASTAGVISGVLYVVDGYTSVVVATNNGYNPSTNAWTSYAADPTPRQLSTAGVISGVLYVVDGYSSTYLANNNGYNPSTNAWTAYAADPLARQDAAAGVISGVLYVVDGNDSAAVANNNGYNPSTNAWTAYAADPTARDGLAAGVISGVLYAVDGYNGAVIANNNGYNPSTNAWTAYAADPTARADPVAGVINATMYVVDGVNGADLTTNNGYDVASAPNAPTLSSPANASYLDAAKAINLVATYNSTDGANQNAYACRVKVSGASAYSYWNAGTGALQSTIVWNSISTAPGAQFTVALPAGLLTDGNIYNWSLASQEAAGNLQGPFASDFTFNAQTPATVTVNAPSGTVTSATTTVEWTTTPPSGAVQTDFRVVVYSAAQYNASGFTPGSGPSVYDSGVVAGNNQSQVATGLTNYTAYRAYVQATVTGGTLSAWTSTAFTVGFDFPAQPGITAAPATDANGTPYVLVTCYGHDNLLSLADSSFEGGVGSAVAGAGTAIAVTAEAALDGNDSLALTATAAGTISAAETTYAVVGGATYAVTTAFRPVSATRSVTATVTWSTGATSPVSVAQNPIGFVYTTGVVTAPATATTAALSFSVASTTAPLGAPAAPAVTTAGTAGTTSYVYAITWVNPYGETVASATTTITTGNATLSATNYNIVTPPAAPAGAASVRIYGRSGTLGLLATVTPSGVYDDTGAVAPGVASPAADTTGERHDVDVAGLFPGSALGYQLEVLTDLPVAYFPLTDAAGSTTAANAVGSGVGTVNGGVTFGQPGFVASDPSQTSALFDGTSGYISYDNSPVSQLAQFTVGCAFVMSSVPRFAPILCTRLSSAGTEGWEMDSYTGLSFTINGIVYTSGVTPVAGTLYRFIASFNGATLALYVNGTLEASFAATLVLPTVNNFQIGTRYADTPGNTFFPGRIGQVQVFSGALSAARIAVLDAALTATGPGIVQQWRRGGLAGITTAAVTFTDANNPAPVTLRNTPLALPAAGQQATVADYETTPGTARVYSATTSATV